MKIPRLTALLLSLPILFFISCEKTEDVERDNIYYGIMLPMSGAQETPAIVSNGIGVIDANYNRLTKTLSYKVQFSGLSGNATAAHIHGLGEVGVTAPVIQTFSGFPAMPGGSYSGSLLIDGVKIKEEDLLASRYYVNIHTAARPAGEIRGQIILTKL